ncbi:MAG TPA: hypothetical protein VLA11_03435, partial [Woeseiaceae bacterium]|nr:hypothetical protein [Woeseiaceae bacterium]
THQLLGYVEGQLLYRDSHEIDDEDLAARKSRAAAHYADAERLFRTALAAQPNDSGVRLRLVSVMDSRGIERRKETLDILEQGLKHDPWNVGLTQRLAYRLVEFGRLREAMEKLDRFSALPQGKDELLWWSQFEILHDAGRFDEKLAYHVELLVNDPAAYSRGRPLSHLWWTTSSLPLLGLTAEASELYDQVARIPDPEDAGTWPMFAGRTVRQFFLEDAFQATTGSEGEVTETYQPRIEALSNEEILKGWSLSASIDATTLWESGHRERAIQIVEALRHYSGSPGLWAQRQMMYAEQLAAWYVELNRMEDAKPVLQEIASHLQNEVDAGMRHVQALLRLANAYGNLGDTENALLALDTAVEYGGYDMDMCCGDYIPDLVNDKAGARPRHWWTSLEGSPEFEILRTRMRSAVDAQRANIRTLLKTHDMEALLAPLLEPVEPRR